MPCEVRCTNFEGVRSGLEVSGVEKFVGRERVVTEKAVIEEELDVFDAALAVSGGGAEDIAINGDTVTVTTNQNNWAKVRDFLKEKGWDVKEAGLRYVAKERARVTDETTLQKIAAFVEALEADDDVAEVHTNAATSE